MGKYRLTAPYPYFRDGLLWREQVQASLLEEHQQLAEEEQPDTLYVCTETSLLTARILDWDTRFFGTPIARLEHFYFETSASAKQLWSALENWLEDYRVRYISVRLNVVQQNSINFLVSKGFEYINGKYLLRRPLTLYRPTYTEPPRLTLQTLGADSPTALIAMARDSFQHNRFVSDPFFDDSKADEMYLLWLRNLVEKHPEDVWVGYAGDRPVGFAVLSDILTDNRFALVTLIVVDPGERNKGYGRELTELAAEQLKEKGVSVAFANVVCTNVSSLLMFQNAGFQLNSTLLEYRLTL